MPRIVYSLHLDCEREPAEPAPARQSTSRGPARRRFVLAPTDGKEVQACRDLGIPAAPFDRRASRDRGRSRRQVARHDLVVGHFSVNRAGLHVPDAAPALLKEQQQPFADQQKHHKSIRCDRAAVVLVVHFGTTYEVSKGQYVVIDPDELDKLRTENDRAISVSGFIKADELDPLYYAGKSYYLLPDGPVGAKAYTLIHKAMEDEGLHAIAQLVLANREQLLRS
jgi:hypothetical protein